HVDTSLPHLIESCPDSSWPEVWRLIQLGLNHEQQHQELILTDILHAFWCNPFKPCYDEHYPYPAKAFDATSVSQAGGRSWVDFTVGIVSVGAEAPLAADQSCYDNVMGRHDVLLAPYSLGASLVTCGEFLDFISDGGYRRHELWLSDGWNAVQSNGWEHPAYWTRDDTGWRVFGLTGVRPLNPAEPVMQLSFYE